VTDGGSQGARMLAGRYQIGNLIGRGGMADVHIGTDSRLGRRVAIKLLKPSLASDPSFRVRFRREAQDAAKMAHPTIVRIFDAGEETVRDTNGREVQAPFIIMEYVDGRLLKDLINEGPIEQGEALRITQEVLTALEYSHRAGLVHRDIKPGNIMVTPTGQVKVMDFGIARAVSESAATIAQTSTIVGTAQYFSPEQARGEAVDARTDLYSVGIVLFEMLTGRAPFTDDNPVAVAYQHVNNPVPAPSSVNPRVSPAVDAVVLRAVAKDRFGRFQSAAEFRDAVAVAAEGTAGVAKQRKVNPADEFNAALFGVNPSVTAGADATMRQLSVTTDDRVVRTQQRPPVAWIWGTVVVMIAVIAAVMYWVLVGLGGETTNLGAGLSVEIADVTNMSYDEGAATLEGQKLVAERVDKADANVPAGTIISTEPAAGLRVAPQTSIIVTVSSGPPQVAIPQVVGLSKAKATAAIEEAGFVVGTITSEHSASVSGGKVMASTPDGDSTAVVGTAIDLVVSDGKVNIPSVIDKSIGDATSLLSGSEYRLEVTTQPNTGCSGGKVTAQSAKGVKPQGSKITLTYCAAP
jgi:eukaryotic-like serine/threonine-protein kinase